ncbi:MAG: hypothetical protein JWO15_2236 [Sphingomonadales bacterium]|nr:hypothetical protein [Sphingomonadales bacterium]
MASPSKPLIIEVAVSHYRIDRPNEEQVSVFQPSLVAARECLDAGASIIHYHHDWTFSREQQIEQITRFQRELRATHPDALMYPAPMKGDRLWEINEHVKALAESGDINMFSIEMGGVEYAQPDVDGLPSSGRMNFAAANFADCHELVTFANEYQAPISFGVYSLGSIYWIREYADRGLIPAGSFIKIWFAGRFVTGSLLEPQMRFGLAPTERALDAYLEAIGDVNVPWMVSAQGDAILDTPVAQLTLERGGHIRVGIEDVSGASNMTNLEMVEAVKVLASKTDRNVVSGRDTKEYLSIKEKVPA